VQTDTLIGVRTKNRGAEMISTENFALSMKDLKSTSKTNSVLSWLFQKLMFLEELERRLVSDF
jgi:hypothetical protein